MNYTRVLCLIFLAAGIIFSVPCATEARMETFSGIGEYTVSDNETLQQAEDNAVAEALREISEQVGMIVASNTKVKNEVVTYDEIVTVTSNYVKVLDKKIERSMTKDGDIHITARVTANADPEIVLSELKQLSASIAKPIQPGPGENNETVPNSSQPDKGSIPVEYQGSVHQAEEYANENHLSKKGLLQHLITNGYSRATASLLMDHVRSDWKNNALMKAKDYLTRGNYSKKGIYVQLLSPNEGFTRDEAFYAMTNISADWKIQALGMARGYQQKGWTMDKIQQRLSIEGFSKDEVRYAMNNI